MTVKVIGVDESRKKTVTCPHCCSILQYILNDVQMERVSSCGEWDTRKIIRCASCSNGVTVS